MKRFIGLMGALVLVGGVAMPSAALASSSTSWKVYDYNPSGNAVTPVSPSSISGDTASFNFALNTYTALLVTSQASATGDLTGTTLNDIVTVSGVNGTFLDQNGGGCTPDNQSVRFYFATPGFAYDNYWWSNPTSVQLTGSTLTATINVSLGDPNLWSDWNGQNGSSVTAGFNAAVAKVSTVGLSFGGGCFFENGVTTSDGSGTFKSAFSITS